MFDINSIKISSAAIARFLGTYRQQVAAWETNRKHFPKKYRKALIAYLNEKEKNIKKFKKGLQK